MTRFRLGAVLGFSCALALIPATGSLAAAAASTGPAAYRGTPGSAARMTHAPDVSGLPKVASAFRNEGPLMFTALRAARASSGSAAAAPAMSANASVSSPAAVSVSRGANGGVSVVHQFNGVSNLNSETLNGFPITPPDQGLCVGRDATLAGAPKAVWEPVNIAARETSPGGGLLRPDVSLSTLFHDPYAEGDVRCLYDPATQSFYFTEIGFPVASGPASDSNNTTVDVLVMNARGVASYQFDTSLGGPAAGDCFGDQPKTGFTSNALVVSTDEYCGPTESDYRGAIVLAISKSQLVHEDATVKDSVLGPVSLSGIPVTGLDPAIGTGMSNGYLVNSFPFDASGNNNPVASTVGVWSLRNAASVTTGHGTPVLTGRAAPSEPYAFPVPARSTGDGSTYKVNGSVITSEKYLNPDDSRMSGPVTVSRGSGGGVQLWTALDAAVSVKGAPSDAAAWFRIDPGPGKVTGQGYVVAQGANLLYPAIQPQRHGSAAMVFTVTGRHINPSAAYTTLGSRTITTVAAGASPHVSFSDAPPYNTARWGDYSFAALDPGGSGIWLATEYIPPAADQDPFDNWGTSVFEVSGP
ncbi:MAG: hypothetical protein QOG05_2359 [Streptosporangiaceae bacterium]|nr:hypothetical protein [Streptosporangiaceae bacterium]